MKKGVIIIAVCTMATDAFAQKSKIYTAKEYMRNGDMKKAVISINEATTSESTKADGDAWFTRGEVYEKLSENDPSAVDESAQSFMKVLEVKPSYDKEAIDYKLKRIAFKAYNAGVSAYSGDVANSAKSDYEAAYKSFQQVVDIRNVNAGKHFAADKKFDTIAAQALKFQALSAFYGKKNDVVMSVLNKAKANLIARDPFIYSTLIDIYTEKKDDASVEKILDEAKVAYPKNAEISRQEMNYYSRVGKIDVLVTKMEEAVKTDPDNPLLQYNLGVLYGALANPIDDKGELKRPANAKDYETKAEMAYKLAIDADPNKSEYHYNLGALYFNNAADIIHQMNKLGTTDADNKKYDAFKLTRNTLFAKSLPYFQKSYDLLSPNVAKLNADDKTTYRNSLVALQNIYEALGQGEKGSEMSKKIKELDQ
ncbi:MAG: hypothetical protein QM530_00620 [Phycisphaerales bacterium]|nr:hypothetical protein [Phycisphaerales bacterium]